MIEKDFKQTEKQACEWLALMNSDSLSDEEITNFRLWLQVDPSHQLAYDDVGILWSDLSQLEGIIDASDYQFDGRLSLGQHLSAFIANTVGSLRVLKPVHFATAVSVFVLAMVSTYFFVPDSSIPVSLAKHSTQTSEIKELTLADGSVVTLGALSSIEVNYTEDQRRIDLISGEAFFSVTTDPQRPFIVSTSNSEIRVIGTKFEVRRSSVGDRISVLEGIVEVRYIQSQNMSSGQNKQILTANQKLLSGPGDIAPIPQSINQDRPGAWREGRLVYDKASLEEVISDANRYYYNNITIDSDDLKALSVTATFPTNQIDSMMDALAVALPVSVKRLENGDIVLQH